MTQPPIDSLKERDKLELLLIAEAGLEKILKKVKSHIELLKAVDAEKRKRNEKDVV